MGKGDLEEGGKGKGIKKEDSNCVVHMFPLPKVIVNCMYCECVLIKTCVAANFREQMEFTLIVSDLIYKSLEHRSEKELGQLCK